MRRSGEAPSTGATSAAVSQVLVGTCTGVSAALTAYPVGTGQALRYGLAGVAMYALLKLRARGGDRPRIRVRPREWALLFLLALTGQTLFNQLLLGALDHADPATVGSILGCAPVVLATVGALQAGRQPGRRIVAASLLVVAGAVAVEGFGSATPTGLALALGVLVCELAFSLLAVPLLPRLGPLRVAAYSTLLAVPQSLAIGWLSDGEAMVRVPTVAEAAALVFLGLVATVVAFLLWYRALGRLGPERAGLFSGLVPIAAALSALVLGTGTVRPEQVAGSVLVGLGVALGMLAPRRSRQAVRRRSAGTGRSPATGAPARARTGSTTASGPVPTSSPPPSKTPKAAPPARPSASR